MKQYTEFKYEKSIELHGSIIFARVLKYGYDDINERFVLLRTVKSKTFSDMFNGPKRAHKWADKMMDICKQYECGSECYTTSLIEMSV